jgi:hypothetical protein
VAGVIAVRQALDISTGKAVATVLISILPLLVITAVHGSIVG